MKREVHRGFCLESVRESDNLDDVGVDGSITLKCLLKIYDGKAWSGFSSSLLGQAMGLCGQCVNVTMGSIKYGDFLGGTS